MAKTVVNLDNVGLVINQQPILEKINIDVKNGEITTLVGPNGGGKTSIARIILGILKPSSGKIEIKDKIKIGYMPQKIDLEQTVPLKAVELIKLTSRSNLKSASFEQLSKKLGVDKILNQQAHDLSGGQLQKVMFLSAIIGEPDLLVLDEPTQYMDIAAIADFYQILEEIRRRQSCSILLISHDLNTVMEKTDTVFCVNKHICCFGSPESVNKNPDYQNLFGVYQHNHNHSHN